MELQIQKLATLVLLVALISVPSSNARVVSVAWTLGTNYANWVNTAGTFRVGDSLVFTYGGKAAGKSAAPHNVYLLKDLAHYRNCDFRGAVLLADSSKSGYKYKIQQKKPLYFACSVGGGFHCQNGMKFVVNPH